MNWKEAEQNLRAALSAVYPNGEAEAISHLVLDAVSGSSRTSRLLHRSAELTAAQQDILQHHTQRLLQHEPVQYVLQQAHFYGLDLYVNKSVLIPRAETEELVDWVVQDVRKSGKDVFENTPALADKTDELKILDVCTGSGCIALALKKSLPRAEVWGCDISDEALTVARRNGAMLDIRVDFQAVDFLAPEQQTILPSVDIVVCNPPYIPQTEANQMPRNVTAFEPHLALFVPAEDALVFYKALAHFGTRRLHNGGRFYLETHEDLARQTAALMEECGYRNVEIRKDMQGKERMIRLNRG